MVAQVTQKTVQFVNVTFGCLSMVEDGPQLLKTYYT